MPVASDTVDSTSVNSPVDPENPRVSRAQRQKMAVENNLDD